jgi:hypothetical protein
MTDEFDQMMSSDELEIISSTTENKSDQTHERMDTK